MEKIVLNERQVKIIELLKELDEPVRGRIIAQSLKTTSEVIYRIVSQLRRIHTRRDRKVPYIYITKKGYVIRECREAVLYETEMRMSRGLSTIINGKFIFDRCRRLSLSSYNNLQSFYKPRVSLLHDTIGF